MSEKANEDPSQELQSSLLTTVGDIMDFHICLSSSGYMVKVLFPRPRPWSYFGADPVLSSQEPCGA
jgi:hypothetical protein